MTTPTPPSGARDAIERAIAEFLVGDSLRLTNALLTALAPYLREPGDSVTACGTQDKKYDVVPPSRAEPGADAVKAADAFFAEVMLDKSEEERIRPALLRHLPADSRDGVTVVTDDMLQAAVESAVSSGLIPRMVFIDQGRELREKLRAAIDAAIAQQTEGSK